MFNWIVSDTYQYLQPFNYALKMRKWVYNHIYLVFVYVRTAFIIEDKEDSALNNLQ